MSETTTLQTSESDRPVPESDKPDFSNYTWFAGAKAEYNSISVAEYEGKLYVGIKGYDKKSNAHGYIQAEFTADVLRQLRDHLDRVAA